MPHLIFSPYYDGNCYAGNPEKNKCELGTKYVGPIGLLNELELRAGLSRGETTPMQRTIAYCNAIQEVLNGTKDKPFYKQSFENDPLGVAQQLLRWRDALCMAGWNKDTQLPEGLSADGKNRLSNLQEIESHFNAIGMGERWRALLEEATKLNILPSDVTITLDMKMELLPPVIRKVLKAIQEKGGHITESEAVTALGNRPLSDFADKFTLYQFTEQNDAYQWAALQEEKADVYINEDNFTFNQVLKSVGKPLVAASVNGATDLSQLLKLGIALFRAPVNYTNLMSYLSIFRHPIDWENRSALRYHLSHVGGLGDMVNEDGSVTQIDDTAKSYPDFWGMWEYGNNDKVPVNKVYTFCKKIHEWTETAEVNAAAEKILSPMTGTQVCAQLQLLQEQAGLMLAFLDGKTGNIGNDELDKVVATICQGGSVSTDFARLGSCDMLKDIKGLAVNDKTMMWMDCVRKPRPHYEYAFLNPADIKILQVPETGLDISGADLEIRAADFAERLAVSRAKRIIALMPQRKDGERTEEHLLITELRHTATTKISIDTPSIPKSIPIKTVDADTQKVEHHVSTTLFANIDKPAPKSEEKKAGSDPSKFTPEPVGYQREYESFSSLDELINQPFDYVLDYLYNMKDEDSDNLSKVEGNVAHWVISQIVGECKNASGVVDTNKFLTICNNKSELTTKTEKAIHDIGAMLLQPENEMECINFKRIFFEDSIPTLVRIIQNNHLEIVGSEMEFTNLLTDSSGADVFNFNAKIDFLLKRKNPETNELEYLIFDFKWTGNPNKREEELRNGKELQLALYQISAEVNGYYPVVMRGYYLLKQAQLLTTDSVLDISDDIIPPKGNDIFKQAVASYRERIQNLKDGYIEEGEEKKGTEFENTVFIHNYYPKPDEYYLNNDLTARAKKDGMTAKPKKSSYGENAVLKGKIK